MPSIGQTTGTAAVGVSVLTDRNEKRVASCEGGKADKPSIGVTMPLLVLHFYALVAINRNQHKRVPALWLAEDYSVGDNTSSLSAVVTIVTEAEIRRSIRGRFPEESVQGTVSVGRRAVRPMTRI